MPLRVLGTVLFIFCEMRSKLKLERIMSATVRENILFSHEYDEIFYNLVVDGKTLFLVTSSRVWLLLQPVRLAPILRYFLMEIWPKSVKRVCSNLAVSPIFTISFIGITVCGLFACMINPELTWTAERWSTFEVIPCQGCVCSSGSVCMALVLLIWPTHEI